MKQVVVILRRVLKYVLYTVGVVLLLGVVAAWLLYVPAVQRFVKEKAEDYVRESMGMELSVGKIRLKFPVDIHVEQVYLGYGMRDTLVAADAVSVNVGISQLLQGKVEVDALRVEHAVFCMQDSVSGMRLETAVGEMVLRVRAIDLKRQVVDVSLLSLEQGRVYMRLGQEQKEESTEEAAPLKWVLNIEQVELKGIDYRMEGEATGNLYAGVGRADLRVGRISLEQQTVDIAGMDLEEAYCRMLTVASDEGGEEEVVADSVAALPWTVRVGRLNLKEGRFYTRDREQGGGDSLAFPEVLDIRAISLEIDSVYNRGMEVAAEIQHLGLEEAGGMVLRDLAGRVVMDNERIKVEGLKLETPYSDLEVDALVKSGLADFGEATPLEIYWRGELGGRDFLPFVHGLEKDVLAWLREQVFPLRGNVRGSLGQLDIPKFYFGVGEDVALNVEGKVASVTDVEKAEGRLDVSLSVKNGRFARVFTGDGVVIPDGLQVNSTVGLRNQLAEVVLQMLSPEGGLSVDARYGLEKKNYQFEADVQGLNLGVFVPGDSLGMLSAQIKGKGRGMDWKKDEGELVLDLDSLEYKGYTYRDIALQVLLKEGCARGKLNSGNEALDVDLTFEGKVTEKEGYRGLVEGDIRRVDLQALHFSLTPLAFGLKMNVSGFWEEEGNAGLNVDLEGMRFNDGKDYALGDLVLNFGADERQTSLGVDAGDFRVRFAEAGNLQALGKAWGTVVDSLKRQVETYRFDAESLRQVLPEFSLSLKAGKDNVVNRYLQGSALGFGEFVLEAGYSSGEDLRLNMAVRKIETSNLVIDSVMLNIDRRQKALRYGMDLYASASQLKGIGQVGVTGSVVDNQLNVRLREKSEENKEIFNLGANVAFEEEAVNVSLSPEPLVIGYTPWRVNRGNYVRMMKNGAIAASLQLLNEDKRIRVISEGGERDKPESLLVDIKGIDLGGIAEGLSFLPEISGILEADVRLAAGEKGMEVSGKVGVDELGYLQKRVGDIGLSLTYSQEETLRQMVEAGLTIDQQEAVRVDGVLGEGDSVRVGVDFRYLPLRLANVFMPDGTAELDGGLEGKVLLSGSMDEPRLSGLLGFRNGELKAMMVGTTFKLDSLPILIADNMLQFNRWGIIAPNKRRLEVEGNVDFTSFSAIRVNTTISGREFQVIGAEENDESMLYGQAYLDVETSVKGMLNALQVRGKVNLSGNSEINYVLRSSPLDVSDKTEDFVRFVSFQDTVRVTLTDTLQEVETTTIDLLMTLNIDPQVRMNVLLSTNGQNRVSIQGGGELTYSLNPVGDSRLVGRYVLGGGLISYGLPVIGQKEFKIQEGNYVEWTGDLMNPKMNIVAAESISANVTDDSQNSRLVNFQAMIKVDGSLEKPEVVFDLSATGDLTIQNQLAGMTPEERAKEAMNLMIYGTYTAPGTVAKNNMSDNAVNNLVENELNQWSRKHLKGVDLSFGINSYNQVGEGGESKKTDYSYQFSKRLFNNKVRVSVGGRVSTDSNPTEAGRMEENFVDDLSLEYMFGNSSKYFLKLFRHSGYESVLEGEVIQTGISIVLRKKFQEFLDLFRWRKNREIEKREEDEVSDR